MRPDGPTSGEALHVSRAESNVEDGGESSSILGPKSSGVKVGILNNALGKRRIESGNVKRLNDRQAVDEEAVLGWSASLYEHLSPPVPERSDSREGLQVRSEIGTGTGGRNPFKFGGPNRLQSGLLLRRAPRGPNCDFFQLSLFDVEFYAVDTPPHLQSEGIAVGGKANVSDFQ